MSLILSSHHYSHKYQVFNKSMPAGFAIQIPTTTFYVTMNTSRSSFLSSILTLAFFFLTTLPQSYSQKNDTHSICSQLSFSCGTLRNISYPFWGGNRPQFCGRNGFKLTCMHDQNTSVQVGSQRFNVLNINQTASTLRMARTDLVYDRCSSNFTNTSLSVSPFSFPSTVQNVTIFYECPSGINSVVGNTFTCQNDTSKHVFYVVNGTQLNQFPDLHKYCGVSLQVQVSQGVVWESGLGVLEKGFDVRYDAELSSQCTACRDSGGTCGTNENDSPQFSCYCSAGAHASVCSTHKSMFSFLSFLFLKLNMFLSLWPYAQVI